MRSLRAKLNSEGLDEELTIPVSSNHADTAASAWETPPELPTKSDSV
jgi:hypothetical protein